MIRDRERPSPHHGPVFHMPVAFPAHSVAAVRIARLGAPEGWITPLAKPRSEAEPTRGADITDRALPGVVGRPLGLDFARISEVTTAQ